MLADLSELYVSGYVYQVYGLNKKTSPDPLLVTANRGNPNRAVRAARSRPETIIGPPRLAGKEADLDLSKVPASAN